jgi:16S rRNA processing protein RimM
VGKLVAGHGVRGLARVKPFNPTSPTLTACDRVWLVHAPSGRRQSFCVRENRPHRGHFLLAFEGIDSLNDLEPWIGSMVEADVANLPAAADGEVYHFEAVGLEVRTTAGERLGTVVEVMALPAQDVWVIERAPDAAGRPREVLLPMAPDVVREVDLIARVALVEPPVGLVEP